MNIYLVRHGITTANRDERYAGTWEVPLSKEGETELKRFAESGLYPQPEGKRIITTGMLRTEQTLKAIYGDIPHERFPRLKEMDFGIFERKTYGELCDIPEYTVWLSDESGDVVCPGGESRNEFTKRVMAPFNTILSAGEDAVVICHGGTISAIMCSLFPNERNYLYWIPKSGRGYKLLIDEDKRCYTEL